MYDYVENSVSVCELDQQAGLKKWMQPAINEFFKYCFHRSVIPDMNVLIGFVKLSGPKQAVIEAENQYFREQAKQIEQAHLAVIARDIVWAYTKDNCNWVKYSLELNAHIEDEYVLERPTVSINLISVDNRLYHSVIIQQRFYKP